MTEAMSLALPFPQNEETCWMAKKRRGPRAAYPLALDRIRQAMKRERCSQQELARRAGISAATLSEALSGKTSLTLPVVVRICRELDISLDWLMDDESPPHPRRRSELGRVLSSDEEFLLRIAHDLCPNDPALRVARQRLLNAAMG